MLSCCPRSASDSIWRGPVGRNTGRHAPRNVLCCVALRISRSSPKIVASVESTPRHNSSSTSCAFDSVEHFVPCECHQRCADLNFAFLRRSWRRARIVLRWLHTASSASSPRKWGSFPEPFASFATSLGGHESLSPQQRRSVVKFGAAASTAPLPVAHALHLCEQHAPSSCPQGLSGLAGSRAASFTTSSRLKAHSRRSSGQLSLD